MIFSPSLLASSPQEQTITLSARIIDNFDTSEKLSTIIIGSSFQPIIYNVNIQKFNPIFYNIMATSSRSVEQFSFNVHYKEMTCSTSAVALENKNIIRVSPTLSIEPGNIREIDNKIMLSGPRYWSVVEFNGSNQYIANLNLKVSFDNITQLQQESLYCVGYIILLSSIDI